MTKNEFFKKYFSFEELEHLVICAFKALLKNQKLDLEFIKLVVSDDYEDGAVLDIEQAETSIEIQYRNHKDDKLRTFTIPEMFLIAPTILSDRLNNINSAFDPKTKAILRIAWKIFLCECNYELD